MNKKLNKLVTNYPVELTEEEVENLSATLAPVIAACGGGGGGTVGKIYTGTGYVNVNNTTNQIGLTEDANDKLNKEYVEYNEYSTAIANRYTKTQTNALLDEKQETLEFEYDENNKVSAINGSALAGQGGGTGDYSAGTDLKIENNIISVDTNGNPNNTASNTRNFVEGSWTVASGYNSHAEGMATTAYGYAVHAQGMWTKFSSSKWSDTQHSTPIDIYWAAGAGATVEGYCNATTSCPMSGTEGKSDYGPIHGGIIKVIGNGNVVHDQSVDPDAHIHTLQPSDALIIFKDGCISAAGNISANGIELGAGGTTYQGRKGVNVDGSYVELTQDAYESVTSVPNISNDVTTLKNASANWNKVSDKLDTTAFSNVSGDFVNKTDLNDYYKKTETSSKEALETAFESKQYNLTQEQLSAISSVSSKLTKASADTLYAPISVTGDVDTLKSSSGDWNKVNDKLDTTAFSTVSSKFLTAHQSLDEYATKEYSNNASANALSEAETWVGQQGFYTKASGDNDYAPKSVTATINTLTGASAGWNEVTAKLDASVAAQTYLTTSTYANDSATFVTSSSDTITGTKQYALTTSGWTEVQTGATLTANSGININNNLINVELGRNLKFDTYSNVTTEDNIRISSVRAGEYDNQYTIVNKYGLETYFSSAPDSAKLTLTTNGLNNTLVGGNRCITANYDLNHLFFKSYDNIGTYSGDYSQVEIKVMQETAPEATQHRSSITLTDYYGDVEHTGLITVEKIAQWDQGGGFTGVTTAGSISGDGLTNPLGLVTSAEQALISVSSKVDKPTSLIDKYLALRTDNAGDVSGWVDLKDNFYSKSEASGTFVATAFIDTTTLSGNGNASNRKLGVNTDVIATKDYVNSSFLPLSGGTVSGSVQFSVASGQNILAVASAATLIGASRQTTEHYGVDNTALGTTWVGVGGDGMHQGFIKYTDGGAVGALDSNSTIQLNLKPSTNKFDSIQVQINGGSVGYLIPAVTSTTTAGLTNDGILHIILES